MVVHNSSSTSTSSVTKSGGKRIGESKGLKRLHAWAHAWTLEMHIDTRCLHDTLVLLVVLVGSQT